MSTIAKMLPGIGFIAAAAVYGLGAGWECFQRAPTTAEMLLWLAIALVIADAMREINEAPREEKPPEKENFHAEWPGAPYQPDSKQKTVTVSTSRVKRGG